VSESVLGLKVGDRATFAKTVTAADVETFAAITGDTNPLHLDEAQAARTRFKGRIAHGMLPAGYISAALGTRLTDAATVVYLSQQLRFLKPVLFGDTVTATCEITALDPRRRIATVKTDCHNQDGVAVVSGEAVVLLDERRDQEGGAS
jgi:3-hydroxybutyryl-CoA dehydratase